MIPIELEESKKEFPDSVGSVEDLCHVPTQYLNEDDSKRPLKLTDEDGTIYKYALNPMFYSSIFILVIEAMERFSYYGLATTETAYLSGVYSPSWNPGVTSAEAAAMTSLTLAISFSSPFLGSILSDGFIGEFWTIILGAGALFVPGILLTALSTVPGLLGETFNMSALRAGLLILAPLGTGLIKATVSVLGGKQFHPVLQSAKLESFYINFWMTVNVGAVLGGILIPLLAQINVTVAYSIPAVTMTIGVVIFASGYRRYVQMKPNKAALYEMISIIGAAVACPRVGFNKSKESNGGKHSDSSVDGVKRLLRVIPISGLQIPSTTVYILTWSVLVLQGTNMNNEGMIDASMMTNVAALMVLVSGFLLGQFLYPALAKRGIHLGTARRFALGAFFVALSAVSGLIIDMTMRSVYESTEEKISVLWQLFPYACFGIAEVFTVSTALEATFVVGPKAQKGLAAATNIFMVLGVPGFIAMALDKVTAKWFADSSGGIAAYVDSRVENIWYMAIGIAVFGIILNSLPPVCRWVNWVVEDARLAHSRPEAGSVAVSLAGDSSESS